MANVDVHTTTVNTQPLVLYAVAVARRTIGSNSVEALEGGSLSGCTPSPRRPGGGGSQNKKTTPKKQGGQGKPHKAFSHMVMEN